MRPAVIFGSDGLEGCEHAVFEILSNAIDEAREGLRQGNSGDPLSGRLHSGGGLSAGAVPVDWNAAEQRYNWELVFCELYAGGKYSNNEGENYEYSLGLNGLGACATQYASRYFDAVIRRDGKKYTLHFEKGENIGGLKTEKLQTASRPAPASTGCPIWTCLRTSIFLRSITADILKRQAVVNAGVYLPAAE